MISETTFIDCDNLPEQMAGRFDQPWHFVGEVKQDSPYLCALCQKCAPPINLIGDYEIKIGPTPIVHMNRYLFITGDMLEVTVYFGVCDKCDNVFWARQGPPFKRARRYVPQFDFDYHNAQ